jgi:hypothetical protein
MRRLGRHVCRYCTDMLNSDGNVVLVAVSQSQSASEEGECLRCRIRVNTVVFASALMADRWSVVTITSL